MWYIGCQVPGLEGRIPPLLSIPRRKTDDRLVHLSISCLTEIKIMQIKRALQKFKIMPSTKAFIQEARSIPGQGVIDTLHGYIYGRWPYLCIGLGTGKHRLLRLMKPLWNSIFRILLRFPSDNPQFDTGGLKPGKRQGLSFFREETFADTYHAKVIPLDSAKKIVSVNRKVQLTNPEHVIPY